MNRIEAIAVAVALASCASGSPGAPRQATGPSPAVAASFRVEVIGQGPPMILIPGLASSGETWTTTVEHMRARYTCHVLTLAGFAGVPPIPGPLVETAKADLARYIEAQRLVKPVVVGHSLGGELALKLGADHPDLVGPLVIVDSLPFLAEMMGATSVSEAKPMAEGIRAMMTGQTQAQRDAYSQSIAQSMTTPPEAREQVAAWGRASDPATVAGAFAELLGIDLRPALPRITVPVLVIGTWIGFRDFPGGPDRATIERRFRDQYAALPRMHFAMAEQARHFVMLDDLPWFTAQLDRFLADPEATVRDRGFAAE
jgi:N-formylmaleamate deformylase